ncbi:hyaluronoglucuronidase [Bombyx mandarina]|uniref:Hyaluronoglucuronidase n=1 Tax=Bombyx mandarina TaxID=7092 RepID=A0A6J2JG08_BOMMA|nr:hyaluronoglucuronidase [Bombyx mandarina]
MYINQVLLYNFLSLVFLSTADMYSVKIDTEQHVNVVDPRFLSFTVDPKYLFSTSEKYKRKECLCMAASLAPAYLRIAGPSTSQMVFHNATIAIADDEEPSDLAVRYRQWRKFVQWAKSTGFDLIFALNNEERTATGLWDPNTALNILTVAEKANIGEIFWQLGYECTNQSIEEYLNDLETLRVIVETFPPGRTEMWKVVAGDISDCLHGDSKSDFRDYIVLSSDMMDAIMLNGNSSSQELERMSDLDRLKLLKFLSHSTTPLWLTETTQQRYNELERAVDWLSSLGYSARNGFSVHYRELLEEEMYEPSLSFYMALLFKNLVGERVLNLEMEAGQAIMFAHCTSLRHQAIPGAVTLYGANMDDEPARFSIKLSKKEEGGDIMQFIISHDHNGNIAVNGRVMFFEGDIKPIVKRVRPYKSLLINLPAKSFGFWVLANTNVEACKDYGDDKPRVDSTESSSDEIRVRRSIISTDDNNAKDLRFVEKLKNVSVQERFEDAKHGVGQVLNVVKRNTKKKEREIEEDKRNNRKKKISKFKTKFDRVGRRDSNLKSLRDIIKSRRYLRKRKPTRYNRSKSNRLYGAKYRPKEKKEETAVETKRKRRDINEVDHKMNNINDLSIENVEDLKNVKLLNILRKIHEQLEDLSAEKESTKEKNDDSIDSGSEIVGAGFIKTTVNNLMGLLSDLNENLSKFWNAVTILE